MSSIQAEVRSTTITKSELKQLRANGRIPAVVYGKTSESQAISVDGKELARLLKTSGGGVVSMNVSSDKKARPVMISHIQRDKVRGDIIHIDFHQINMDDEVKTTVRVQYVGDAKGVKEQGGIQQIQLHSLDIRCKPNLIPAAIDVDVTALNVGDSIVAGDVQVPEGVEVTNDPSDVLVSILHAQKQEEEEVADEAVAESEAAGDGAAAEASEEQ